MTRSLRIEKANGVYHVINGGNYRQDVFINEGAHRAFEKCLFEACIKCDWILEGFCVLTNHFHLVIRTPKCNLVYGMQWLQSTFANRYHKFGKVHGKLFQGRYKSLIVEETDYLGSLLHYVHLNPVRAGMVSVESLRAYRWSSFWYLHHPTNRADFMDCSGCLEAAGNLTDSSAGRKRYREYLSWLSADSGARKEQLFDRMCKGWALGSQDFKKGLLAEEIERKRSLVEEDENLDAEQERYDGKELREANELKWEQFLERGLSMLGKARSAILKDKKSEAWKILLAAAIKKHTSATNVWITGRLNMGIPQAVSQNVGKFFASGKDQKKSYRDIIIKLTA